MNQVCAGTLWGTAEAAVAARPTVDGVDWQLSMARIFQPGAPNHHAGLWPLTPICLYYEGRLLISPSTSAGRQIRMKRVRYIDGALDALDTAILAALAEDARTPMRELAQKVGLSAPSTTERVR